VIDATIPDAIVDAVLAPLGVVAARRMPPGMSGACVYQCHQPSGDSVALKRWPSGTRRVRVEEVHQVIQRASDDGCGIVPRLYAVPSANRPETVFTYQKAHWDIMEWVKGEAAAVDASLDHIQQGAAAIARFHASVHSLGVQFQSPPAVVARLRRLNELDALIPQLLEIARQQFSENELNRAISDAARMVQANWGEVRSQIARSLSQYADQHVPTQYVLRDVHREHVLFTDQNPTGLIDFDAVRVDTPATDLARWVGSFLDGRKEADMLWNAAMAGFCDVYSLNGGSTAAMDGRLAKEIHFASTWISLVNWLDWILFQHRSFPPGPKIVALRVRELIRLADQGK
jgi:Ser/Thr protein kinase RdoA (MazF antagonist)